MLADLRRGQKDVPDLRRGPDDVPDLRRGPDDVQDVRKGQTTSEVPDSEEGVIGWETDDWSCEARHTQDVTP